jgi:hypothetical protein
MSNGIRKNGFLRLKKDGKYMETFIDNDYLCSMEELIKTLNDNGIKLNEASISYTEDWITIIGNDREVSLNREVWDSHMIKAIAENERLLKKLRDEEA